MMKNIRSKMRLKVAALATISGVSALSGAEHSPLGGHSEKHGSLEQNGVSLGGEAIYEYSSVLDGGLRRSGSGRGLFVLDLEIDMEQWLSVKGGTLFAHYLNVTRERGGSADAGDIQAYSNMESEYALHSLYEIWYQQELMNDRLRIKVGKVDANTEFAYVDAAGNFANSSAGFSPTLFTFPTYPDPSMSVNVFATAVQTDRHTVTVGYGLYDGAGAVDGFRLGTRGPATFFSNEESNDYFQIAQAAWAWESCGWLGAGLGGRMSVGGWHHNGEFTRFNGSTKEGAHGFFMTLEQQLTMGAGGDKNGVYAFGQYAWADEDVSEIAQHFSVGLVTQGTLPNRQHDSAGIYLSHVDLSDDPAAGFTENETVIDAFYRVQLTSQFYVQPELQYIMNPSDDSSVDDALVGGVRFALSF